jgi:hypothetical protein
MPRRPSAGRYLTSDRAVMQDYPAPVDPVASPIEVGDIVRLNTTTNVIEEVTTADPTNMLGVAKSHNGSVARLEAVDATRILVEHFSDDVAFWFEGSRAPLATDVGKSYGLVLSGGVWVVDLTDTVATRVYIHDVDIGRNAYFCIVLTAHRQHLS